MWRTGGNGDGCADDASADGGGVGGEADMVEGRRE